MAPPDEVCRRLHAALDALHVLSTSFNHVAVHHTGLMLKAHNELHQAKLLLLGVTDALQTPDAESDSPTLIGDIDEAHLCIRECMRFLKEAAERLAGLAGLVETQLFE